MEVRAIADQRTDSGALLDERVERARKGDFAAFEELYHENVGRVHAICLRLTGDRARAEEMTQETFIRAWQRLGTFRGESAWSSWLGRVAVNAVFSERRWRSRREDRETPLTEHAQRRRAPVADGGAGAMDLEQAIAALPKGARHVFVLHDIEGYRHDEVARLLGIAAGTSKAQLHRARKLLREALQ
jgi:RNA polymerase sigma-70 factor (ECF subfamily)